MTSLVSLSVRVRPPSPVPVGSGRATQAASARFGIAHRLTTSVALWVGAWTVALYALTFLVVRRHYAEYGPHYDSIGIFAASFELLNEAHAHGIASVLGRWLGNAQSWLQPAYTLGIAWAPVKAPEWLVSLNFVLLLAAQAAVVTYGRTFQWSRQRQVLAAMLVVLPGGLYPWDGGLQDLRRDIQLVVLALGVLFMALAYVSAPSWQRGIALGVLVGLAQWSRDNAAAVIVIVALPAIVVALLEARSRGGPGALRHLLGLALVPVGVFVMLAGPYYAMTLPQTIVRYQSIVWGIGEDRLASLLAFWNTPLSVLLGGDSRLSGRVRTALATTALLLAGIAASSVLWRSGYVEMQLCRLRERGPALLLASGAWVIVAVLLYNSVLLGYGARWHAMPYLPMAVGLVAMLVGLTGAIRWRPEADRGLANWIVAAVGVVLVASAPVRMILNQQPALGAAEVRAMQSATVEIERRAGDRPVAFLAYDTLSRHHARYYAALAGRPNLVTFEPLAVEAGDPIDLDQPLRDTDRPEELRARLDQTLRAYAGFALVYADTARYDDPREPLWPYQIGKPVVDGLLADPAWAPVARFTLRERELVLLENTDRPVGASR